MSTAVISDFPRPAGLPTAPFSRPTSSRSIRSPLAASASRRTWPQPPAQHTAEHALGPAPSGRLRLTKRGRAVLTAVVALPLAAGVAAFVLSGASAVATPATTSIEFDYVQVESGQSLWQLAAAVAPDADPRDVVSDIVHLNQLQSTDVQPGQRLAVPLQYTK